MKNGDKVLPTEGRLLGDISRVVAVFNDVREIVIQNASGTHTRLPFDSVQKIEIPNSLEEIKEAVRNGKSVYWQTKNYKVILDNIGQYLIWSQFNDNYCGLTWIDGISWSYKPEQFFVVA